ncbi:MAG TPA: ABC transporter substrate-binding protein [Syntrophomonas sp.]|nr:ABC transporter substrate-binding protein [Syntrophomonas sp.]
MKKLSWMIAVILMISIFAAGCGSNASKSDNQAPADSYDTIMQKARGTTVTFYGWGGDQDRNKWLETVLVPQVKQKYDITLKIVPMDIDQILSKLGNDKQAGKTVGSIDMIWINGENFYSAKGNGFLFGPFTDKLPSYTKYIDANAPENKYDFGFAIDGYEAPYGKAQIVLINDRAVTPETPKNTAELMEYVKKYPGKVTYPALPDFTGSAFVRNIIYDICGYEQFATMKADKATVKKAIQPALDYLKQLNPYLWNQGKTFPATSAQVDNMFADGELVLNMSYSPYSVANAIAKGTYKDTARTFLLDKGTIGNTNYIAIAGSSANKEGAMVVINEIMSPEMQASMYDKLKQLPVVDYDKLNADEKKMFDSVELGKGVIPQSELLSKRVPEMPANLIPIIEEIWAEEVVGK